MSVTYFPSSRSQHPSQFARQARLTVHGRGQVDGHRQDQGGLSGETVRQTEHFQSTQSGESRLVSQNFFGQALQRIRSKVSFVFRDERGAATAEYAVVVMAAVGFAGLLVVILRGNEIKAMLTDLVKNALGSAG